MLKRILEPEVQYPKEDVYFCEYKEMVWADSDVLKCIPLIPREIMVQNWSWLQVIDLWWWDWLFINTFSKHLPDANFISMDKSQKMVEISKKRNIHTVYGDMMNFFALIESNQKLLVVCRWTIHHLDKYDSFFKHIEKLPITVGLFIKDLLRPNEEKDVEGALKEVISLAKWMQSKNSDFFSVIEQLTRQSLFAALSEWEVRNVISAIKNISFTYNKEKTYYEITRMVS